MADQPIQLPSSIVSSILSPLLQGGANLQSTNTNIANTNQNTTNQAAATPGIVATSTLDQQKATATNYINNAAQTTFAPYIKKGIPITASIYNQVRSNMPVAPGVDTNTFDSNFQNNIDTNNVWQYNTDSGIASRTLH